jgi:hypothetical protein
MPDRDVSLFVKKRAAELIAKADPNIVADFDKAITTPNSSSFLLLICMIRIL